MVRDAEMSLEEFMAQEFHKHAAYHGERLVSEAVREAYIK